MSIQGAEILLAAGFALGRECLLAAGLALGRECLLIQCAVGTWLWVWVWFSCRPVLRRQRVGRRAGVGDAAEHERRFLVFAVAKENMKRFGRVLLRDPGDDEMRRRAETFVMREANRVDRVPADAARVRIGGGDGAGRRQSRDLDAFKQATHFAALLFIAQRRRMSVAHLEAGV